MPTAYTSILRNSRAKRQANLRRIALRINAARMRIKYADNRARLAIAEVARLRFSNGPGARTSPERAEAEGRARVAIEQVKAAHEAVRGYRAERERLRAEAREETASAHRAHVAALRLSRVTAERERLLSLTGSMRVPAAPPVAVLVPATPRPVDAEEDR